MAKKRASKKNDVVEHDSVKSIRTVATATEGIDVPESMSKYKAQLDTVSKRLNTIATKMQKAIDTEANRAEREKNKKDKLEKQILNLQDKLKKLQSS